MSLRLNNRTYDFTENGKCKQCGECCTNLLPMTEDEIKTIRRYIKHHKIKEQKHRLPLSQPIIDMTCPFLNDGKKEEKCLIYCVRPKICRNFICRTSLRLKLDLDYLLQANDRKD